MNFLRRLTAVILRIFFRRISIAGLENILADAPVIFAPNHPNSLVDPLFLLAFAPREVTFLAKEPLFRMPIIGRLVRAAGSIPVYRKQDQADMSRNRETFARVREVLSHGGAVALFPEGVSHNDPALRPFKTGAARMALGATAMGATEHPVLLIPTGLYYTSKATFRSSALICFGPPVVTPSVTLEADGEPPAAPVRELTAQLASALAEVTLQADRHEALELATRAERIFSSADEEARRRDLADRFEARRRFLAGYDALRRRAPEQLARLQTMITRYEEKLAEAGLSPENLAPGRIDPWRIVGYTGRTLLRFLVMLPLALVGMVIHWPAYQLVGPLAAGFAPEYDVVATTKIMVAATAFPLTWIAVALVVGWNFGPGWGAVAFVVTPFTGYVALLFLERLDRVIGGTRALALLLVRPMAFQRLVLERRQIRDTILAVGNTTLPDLMPTRES